VADVRGLRRARVSDVKAWRAVALLLTSASASAHGTGGPGLAWTFDAWVIAPLLLSLSWFVIGFLRLRARSVRTASHARQALWFGLGWCVLAGALVSPLHAAGERSFAAHMLEHELLMLVAAPLLVLSRPLGIALWALPHVTRVRWGNAGLSPGWQAVWGLLTAPVVATLLQAVALWGWHAPPAFDVALAQPGWHVAQHVTFLATALLFWWAVLRAHRNATGLAVGCLFFTAVVSGALGALMAFSSSPWYLGYARVGLDAFGLDPVEDQQLAGLLMWVPGGLVHAAAGIALLARGLSDKPREAKRTSSLACIAALLLIAPLARGETLYISDEQANVVHVVVAPHWHVAERIAVGARPRGIAIDRAGKRLFVAVSNDDRIEVIDLRTRRVIGHVPSGPDPERFALSTDERTLYIANEDDAQVSFVDIASGRLLGTTDVGAEPEGMAASPDGRWVVCTSETASLVHFVDAKTHRLVDSVPVGTRPRDAVFSPDGRWLWVSSEARATVAVFDMRTRRVVRTIDFDRDDRAPDAVQAVGIALSPDGQRAYVALGRGNHVAEVDAATGRILRYYDVGSRNWGLALSRDATRAYAANGLSGDATVLDLVAHRTLATIRTGGKPWGVAVGP
jgi:PQQ-dependent catabolism-associated beta-propeller protein